MDFQLARGNKTETGNIFARVSVLQRPRNRFERNCCMHDGMERILSDRGRIVCYSFFRTMSNENGDYKNMKKRNEN